MYAEERQHAVARLVSERGRVAVTALATEYDVTTETIRRDLSSLERVGLVRRVHGGAVPSDALPVVEPALGDRDQAHAEAKDRIAEAALALLPHPGASVLLDAGSTTGRLAGRVPAGSRLAIWTHAVPIAARLTTLAGTELHLLPGVVRATTQAAVGPETVEALGRLRADVAFLGTNGLSLLHGLSTPDTDEAATKRALVGAARRVVVLADASKIGEESVVRFATLAQVDVLVTDDSVSTEDRADLEHAGIEVLVG